MLLAHSILLVGRPAHQTRHGNKSTIGRWPLRCTAVATPTRQAPSTTTKARTPCHVRIGGEWKDLTAWAAAHPAGSHSIVDYHGRDATDVFFAFHSTEARTTLTRLPPLRDAATAAALEAAAPPCSREQRAFRALRSQLEQEGWFERSIGNEVGSFLLLFYYKCCHYFARNLVVRRPKPTSLAGTAARNLGAVSRHRPGNGAFRKPRPAGTRMPAPGPEPGGLLLAGTRLHPRQGAVVHHHAKLWRMGWRYALAWCLDCLHSV